MAELKLFQLLDSLDKYEKRRFEKFLDSPYFNTNSKVKTLFQVLTVRKNPGRKEIWKKIFPGKAYDDSRFRRLCSDLVALARHFYAVRRFEKTPTDVSNYFMKTVYEKKLTHFFNSSERDARRSLEKANYTDAGHYLDQYRFEQEKHLLASYNLDRAGLLNFEEMASNLDNFYIAEKLKLYCEILSWQKVAAVNYKVLLMDEIIDHLSKQDEEHVPPVAIYLQMVLTLQDSDDTGPYFELKRLLAEFAEMFPHEEARNMYACAQNFCIRMINKGRLEFLTETFGLYKEVLDRKIIWHNGTLSPYDYKNIVVVALRLKEYNWAEQFIEEFKPRLPEGFRENAYIYNLAKFHFYKKAYPKVIELLQKVEYHDVFYNLDSKAMLMKTYYETSEFDALEALIDSFKVLLRRKKVISGHHRSNYGNFIKFVKKMIRLIPGDKKAAASLKKSIEQTRAIADKAWLLDKLGKI